ncbi:MAG: AAA family ATPase, partial [Caulobacter sp.]|nr:AAA family ATPase [Caulobacter sp.]
MTDAALPLLARIADALERLVPPAPAAPDFTDGRLFRHDPKGGSFVPAPDYPMALDLLVGVDRQKDRFVENLRRFAVG